MSRKLNPVVVAVVAVVVLPPPWAARNRGLEPLGAYQEGGFWVRQPLLSSVVLAGDGVVTVAVLATGCCGALLRKLNGSDTGAVVAAGAAGVVVVIILLHPPSVSSDAGRLALRTLSSSKRIYVLKYTNLLLLGSLSQLVCSSDNPLLIF